MIFTSLGLLAILVLQPVSALPHSKRISEIIDDAKGLWEQACVNAGGSSQQCNGVGVTAAAVLFASNQPCDQQTMADTLVNTAKGLTPSSNYTTQMITLAQIFLQQPRDSPDGTLTPYCQTAPQNEELFGYYPCQWSGSNFNAFSRQGATTPPGLDTVSPPGSCPASPSGGVPDGQQLNQLVQSPGTPDPRVAAAQRAQQGSAAGQ